MAGDEAAGAAAGPGAGSAGGYDGKCVFCRIARREEPGTALLSCEVGEGRRPPRCPGGGAPRPPPPWPLPRYEDLVCFRDIKPDAPHHYLVVPVEHMENCKTLKTEHIPIVKRMMEVGKAVLQKNNFSDLDDIRMGFHWPPFCSIAHLHLHVLAPASQLGFLSRLLYRINSYWFITVSVMQMCFAVGFRLQAENAVFF
uniref:Adenosine 5'-monophosphoramidase HINT3 n=1 Tax=Falco tinnunculus TaxID=100819 RepID=A0A8C4U6W2_FALTI